MGTEPSHTKIARSASSKALRERSTPMASRVSWVSRIPAVSVSRRRVEPTITVSSTVSRVVPGMSVTITRSQPARAFKRLDFPTLGRPTMAAETPCRRIRPCP